MYLLIKRAVEFAYLSIFYTPAIHLLCQQLNIHINQLNTYLVRNTNMQWIIH